MRKSNLPPCFTEHVFLDWSPMFQNAIVAQYPFNLTIQTTNFQNILSKTDVIAYCRLYVINTAHECNAFQQLSL